MILADPLLSRRYVNKTTVEDRQRDGVRDVGMWVGLRKMRNPEAFPPRNYDIYGILINYN